MIADNLRLVVLALFLEAALGYPGWLFRAVGHPVSWIGALIGVLDRRLNQPQWSFAQRRIAGIAALGLVLGATAIVTGGIGFALGGIVRLLVLAFICASLPAQRSLYTHVANVARALDTGGLSEGRVAVAMIVGRNPAHLDQAGVARAAIESLAENFSDGVVAPTFWIAVGGLPGGALYKAINTADSMIGHKSERYRAFGWAAARLDDLVNLPASRLAAILLVLAAALTGNDARGAVRAVRRDATRHRSPNAGWPEAAIAGALGLQLAGPRVYGDVEVQDSFMGQGRRDAGPKDIRDALRLYLAACLLQFGGLLCLAFTIGAL